MKRALLAALFFVAAAAPAFAASTAVFTSKPDDPKAVYAQDLGAKGDGKSDDSAALHLFRVAASLDGRFSIVYDGGRFELRCLIFARSAARTSAMNALVADLGKVANVESFTIAHSSRA